MDCCRWAWSPPSSRPHPLQRRPIGGPDQIYLNDRPRPPGRPSVRMFLLPPGPSEPNFRPQASRPLSAETGRSYLTESNDVRPSGMPRDRPHVHLAVRARVQATAEDGRQDIVRRRMTSPRPVRFMQTRMTDHRSAISPQSGAGCPQRCGSSHRTGRRPGIAIKFAQPGAFAGGIGHDKTGGGETPGGRSCGVSLPAGPSERM